MADPFNPDVNEDPDSVFDDQFLVDPEKDYLADLVGEDKPYKTEKDLARAVMEKEAFIRKLKSETKGMRDEINKRQTAQELFDQFKSAIPAQKQAEPNLAPEPRNAEKPMSQEELRSLIERTLSDEEKKKAVSSNYQAVVDALTKKYGSQASRIIASKAKELDVDMDFMKRMASERPKAFLALVDDKPSEDVFEMPIRSEVNSSGRVVPSQTVRNEAYYDKIRDTNPKLFWQASTQAQMHKDAQRLGDSFFN